MTGLSAQESGTARELLADIEGLLRQAQADGHINKRVRLILFHVIRTAVLSRLEPRRG